MKTAPMATSTTTSAGLVLALWLAMPLAATGQTSMGQTNASITDGEYSSAEGVLNGYYVQADGETLCVNPFVIGQYISCNDHVVAHGTAYVVPTYDRVWADTNGVLGGRIVVGSDGQEVCRDPMVRNTFRGPRSYISC